MENSKWPIESVQAIVLFERRTSLTIRVEMIAKAALMVVVASSEVLLLKQALPAELRGRNYLVTFLRTANQKLARKIFEHPPRLLMLHSFSLIKDYGRL
jgi:CRISPR/Cas system-associated endonuclease Cas1